LPLIPPPRGGGLFWIFSVFFFLAFGVLEAVTLSVNFNDVDTVRESVEERAGEAFVAEDLGPVFKG